MTDSKRPETIENRWDILYRDYPDVYDTFAREEDIPVKDLAIMFEMQGKRVIDVGSGTGRSTFELAPYAGEVIGIEPEENMIRVARNNLASSEFRNVEFKKGTSDNIPLPDHAFDFVVSITGGSFFFAEDVKRFVKEAERVLTKNGHIIVLGVPPGWYGGELESVIIDNPDFRKHMDRLEENVDGTFISLGFNIEDIYQTQEFRSLDHILSTYGFIFGKNAIEYIKAHSKTTIKWCFRIYSKQV